MANRSALISDSLALDQTTRRCACLPHPLSLTQVFTGTIFLCGRSKCVWTTCPKSDSTVQWLGLNPRSQVQHPSHCVTQPHWKQEAKHRIMKQMDPPIIVLSGVTSRPLRRASCWIVVCQCVFNFNVTLTESLKQHADAEKKQHWQQRLKSVHEVQWHHWTERYTCRHVGSILNVNSSYAKVIQKLSILCTIFHT